MKRIPLILTALTLASASLAVAGCVSAERVAEARSIVDAGPTIVEEMNDRIAALQADLARLIEENEAKVEVGEKPDEASVSAARAMLEIIKQSAEERDALSAAVSEAQQTLSKDGSAWGWAEAIAGAAGVIGIPGAGLAGVLIKRGREDFEGLVASISAGGGPANSQATREAMKHYPGLKDRVTSARVKLGDKRIEAVPSRNNEGASS